MLGLCWAFVLQAKNLPNKLEYSKAGYFSVANGERQVASFNVGWRFLKGDVIGAELPGYDDSSWPIVNCPHGLEYLPDNASGLVNYVGKAWYRKHFTLDKKYKSKVNKLHFEAVMGKSKVWVNGTLVHEQFGGYLPFSIDLNPYIRFAKENVVVVMTDNSDDPTYGPGKPQSQVDFSYFGGIYRDVWLVTTNAVFVTNPNDVNMPAGGGILSEIKLPSKDQAQLNLKVNLSNASSKKKTGRVHVQLKDTNDKVVAESEKDYQLDKQNTANVEVELTVNHPQLWTPWSPTLYKVEVNVLDDASKTMDAVAIKTGLRTIEFKGNKGFFLNGEKYPGKLIGGNRHQDYATLGNALPNSGQWRDALLLKKAGMDVVRTGHYPPDPAFMDACDALGIFIVMPTPGWQFWNKDQVFVNNIYKDIRAMVRRDRNRPCMLLYEPILNETHYPDWFAKAVHQLVHEERPVSGTYTACDSHLTGHEYFDVLYAHPHKKNIESISDKCIFTREWGDNVDDWSSNNSTSRILREWGETAQLIQAKHYGDPEYDFTSLEKMANMPDHYVGGTMWHAMDHQRGCFTIPFYGGVMDVFRLPKYSYHLFASQRKVSQGYEPMVYIAHEMSQASTADVSVYTNCEAVRLIKYERDTVYAKVADLNKKMASPIVTFKDFWHFMEMKPITRAKNFDKVTFIAEGLIDGKVVARQVKRPSYKPSKIVLKVLDEGIDLVGNGSDVMPVVAYVTDRWGEVKRLDDHYIKCEVSGEGELIAPNKESLNPRKTQWGTAPFLIRSTMKPGKVIVRAKIVNEASGTLTPAELVFESVASTDKMVYSEIGSEANSELQSSGTASDNDLKMEIKRLQSELNDLRMEVVGKQQQDMEKLTK
jgi:beta-galactosidase